VVFSIEKPLFFMTFDAILDLKNFLKKYTFLKIAYFVQGMSKINGMMV